MTTIRKLRDEAAEAGDFEQVKICDRALRGSKRARRAVLQTLRSVDPAVLGEGPEADPDLPFCT